MWQTEYIDNYLSQITKPTFLIGYDGTIVDVFLFLTSLYISCSVLWSKYLSFSIQGILRHFEYHEGKLTWDKSLS